MKDMLKNKESRKEKRIQKDYTGSHSTTMWRI